MNSPKQPYTANDILRYLQGEMSNAEMHRMESEALEDPFLQDAIDGFLNLPGIETNAIAATAAELQAFKPDDKTGKYKNVVIAVWQKKIVKYAAAAIIAGSGGWFLINRSQPYNRDLIAEAKAIEKLKQTEADSLLTAANQVKTTSFDTSASDTPTMAENTPGKSIAKVKKPAVGKQELPSAANTNRETAAIQFEDNAVASAATAPSAARQDAGEKPTTGKKIIAGKVLDVDNYPLDNISLNVKGSNNRAITDELGRFNLPVTDSQSVIIASGRGYKTYEMPAYQLKDKQVLKMERAEAAAEVAIDDSYYYREPEDAIDTVEAVPAGGWDHFVQYLEKINPKKKKARKTVEVTLTFEVDRKGNPSEFQIVKSAGEFLDAEAIKAIKEGPKWKNKTRNPYPIVKLTLVF